MSPAVLLVGVEAESLASRLAISGYAPLLPSQVRLSSSAGLPEAAEPQVAPGPQAVILSPGSDRQIAALRRRWGAIPVLLGIDQDTVANRCRTLTSGADDFWLCSLGPSDLLTRLRLHLNLQLNRRHAAEAWLQVADLELLPASRQVKRGQRTLALTSREYELLLLLARHRDEVVSRKQILSEIWDDQPASASNVIEVYVRYLRQKLEEGGEDRLIHTVRGEGYCLGETRPPRQRQ
ncbi:MAG: response regulator transcription factor [Synechococcaceae cyanobacterium ELA263]